MGEVEQLEARIQELPPEELARFRQWFTEYDAQVWDRQIESDSRSGKLDALKAAALADFQAGKAREL